MKTSNATKAAFGMVLMYALLALAFWGTVGYIAIHFIKKIW